jgi:uncharacterized membrane protein YsdA (DUF1294 family)
VAFTVDKRRAQNNRARTSERTLLGFAAIGSFGALAAMYLFRHKTRKIKFYLVPLFAGIHLVLMAS